VNGYDIEVSLSPQTPQYAELNILGANFGNTCSVLAEQDYVNKTARLAFQNLLIASTGNLEKASAVDQEKASTRDRKKGTTESGKKELSVIHRISSWLRTRLF